jgi:hypothetical protein
MQERLALIVNSGKLKVTNDFIGWHSPWGGKMRYCQ